MFLFASPLSNLCLANDSNEQFQIQKLVTLYQTVFEFKCLTGELLRSCWMWCCCRCLQGSDALPSCQPVRRCRCGDLAASCSSIQCFNIAFAFQVDLARKLAVPRDGKVMADEFTSVLDRRLSARLCASVASYVPRLDFLPVPSTLMRSGWNVINRLEEHFSAHPGVLRTVFHVMRWLFVNTAWLELCRSTNMGLT